MAKERDDKFDPTRPTLVVQHGNTARKYRRLEKDVFVLGRAAGCDIGLDAPDVAPVHCVIVRAADGWRVRDCTGRGGTRLNGRSVQDEALVDEDILQLGSFSFALHLPKQTSRPEAAAPRLRRSRENLARLALRLRGRLRAAALQNAEVADEGLAVRQEELDRQADELEELRRDLDARLGELRQTRQEIAAETLALLQRNERSEKELAERQARVEAAAREVRRESAGDEQRALEIRGRELSHFAGHLRRERLRLAGQEESLAAARGEWLRKQQAATEYYSLQKEQIAREEALLRGQRSEVVRLMGEMRQLRQIQRQQEGADAESLRRENEDLRRGLAERDAALTAATTEAAELRGRLDAADAGGRALERSHFELEEGLGDLDGQIRAIQDRYTDLERATREAESRIALGRERLGQEREELQRLRDGLRPNAASPTQDTVVDMPSPLHSIAEAPRAPSRLSAAAE